MCYVCVSLGTRLPDCLLYKARIHLIEPFRAQASLRSSLTCHRGTHLRVSVTFRGAPLKVTISQARNQYELSLIGFACVTYGIPLEVSDPRWVVQGPTD